MSSSWPDQQPVQPGRYKEHTDTNTERQTNPPAARRSSRPEPVSAGAVNGPESGAASTEPVVAAAVPGTARS